MKNERDWAILYNRIYCKTTVMQWVPLTNLKAFKVRPIGEKNDFIYFVLLGEFTRVRYC